jgi:diguanylate cyclase (GGDEF)-like protein
MSAARGAWSTQQLAEFVVAVSSAEDEDEAVRVAVERAAEALEAEVGALLAGPRVVAAIGYPPGAAPAAALFAATREAGATVAVPGLGECPAVCAPVEGEPAGSLVLARRPDEPFEPEELALLRGMARTLALTLRMLRTLASERRLRARSQRQARDNARLVATLRTRQRLLEGLGRIQRSISQRSSLEETLDAVVSVAGDLLGDELPALLLRDQDDPHVLEIVAARNIDADTHGLRRRPVGEGVAGRAVLEQRLVVVEDYAASPFGMEHFRQDGLQAAMAAPVIEDGEVVGSLLVSSREPGRTYGRADRETLVSLAEHASLALTNAKTINAMLHQAMHDALTGLPNRALFHDRLEHALARARRRESRVAVLFADLDRFKTVNDSLGHASGDELLVAVAGRLGQCLRAGDTAARLGGDEFGILLEDIESDEEALGVAERIVDALTTPFLLQGREVFARTSIGVACGRGRPTDLLRHADVAMYRAKDDGRGRVRLFEPSMQAAANERLEIENELQRAESRGELEVFYQPIVDLADGRPVACEALLRWRHPTKGLIGPPAFVPVAEETGLIVPIGRFVLARACRDLAAWRESLGERAPRAVTVNLSARQLEEPDLVDDVAGALAETGLEPRRLVLEITETVLMRDTEQTIARLEELKAAGVQLAVDDFGTGYSSLRYLRRFPIDVLKLARPFIECLDTADEEGRALARTIIDLGTSLGLQVIAEGIETDGQLAGLQELGCGLGQGFLFARPLEHPAMERLVRGAALEAAAG